MIFFYIGLAGFLWVLFANLLGGDHDGEVDHDVSHDFGGDHDVGHDIGHESEFQDQAAHGPSPFSMRTFSIFMMIFGFGGSLAKFYGVSNIIASLIGIGSGFIAAAIGFQLIKILYGQQADSTINIAELVGKTAEVINTIPSESVGEVTIIHRGQRKDLLARSSEGSILAGTKVKIIDDLGSSVLVSKKLE